jgi:hypothetical protein
MTTPGSHTERGVARSPFRFGRASHARAFDAPDNSQPTFSATWESA